MPNGTQFSKIATVIFCMGHKTSVFLSLIYQITMVWEAAAATQIYCKQRQKTKWIFCVGVERYFLDGINEEIAAAPVLERFLLHSWSCLHSKVDHQRAISKKTWYFPMKSNLCLAGILNTTCNAGFVFACICDLLFHVLTNAFTVNHRYSQAHHRFCELKSFLVFSMCF